MSYPLGICTWSLHDDVGVVKETLDAAGLKQLHLHVAAVKPFSRLIEEEDLRVSAMMLSFPQEDYSTLQSIRQTGGIVPQGDWLNNEGLALDAINMTAAWNVPYLSFHAGFIDRRDTRAFETFTSRLLGLADAALAAEIGLLLETGQEHASELRACLEAWNHPALGVNFDPANMLLYGMGDPVEALHVLAPWIRHIHIKDACVSEDPSVWGKEVPWGDGEVDSDRFFKVLRQIDYSGALAIEREAGSQRKEDILLAVERITQSNESS